jgi:hypothetical protein
VPLNSIGRQRSPLSSGKVITISFSVSLLTPVVRGVMLCAGLVPHHVLFCYVGKVFGLPVYRFPYGTSWTFRGNRSLQYCQYRWELVPFPAFPFRALMKIFAIRSSSQVFTCCECRFVRWSDDNAGYGHVRNTHPLFLIKDIIHKFISRSYYVSLSNNVIQNFSSWE